MEEISEDIIRKAAHRDVGAFEFIYQQCSGFVHNVAFRVVSSQDDAEEVTQEVFISVYRNLENFKFNSSFKTWIYRITINTAINVSKRLGRVRKREVNFDESIVPVSSPVRTDDKVDENEKHEQIAKMLDQLTDDQKTCLILRSVEGLSYQEISETLQININTVRTRIKRARVKLVELKKR